MKKISNETSIELSGYITIADKDKYGNIIQLSLETEDFRKFIIAENDVSQKLFNFINKKVWISGELIDEHFDDHEIIYVNNFGVE